MTWTTIGLPVRAGGHCGHLWKILNIFKTVTDTDFCTGQPGNWPGWGRMYNIAHWGLQGWSGRAIIGPTPDPS